MSCCTALKQNVLIILSSLANIVNQWHEMKNKNVVIIILLLIAFCVIALPTLLFRTVNSTAQVQVLWPRMSVPNMMTNTTSLLCRLLIHIPAFPAYSRAYLKDS